jgi:hypothetical protein
MELHFLIMIKLTAHDLIEAVEIIHENNSVAVITLERIINTFQSHEHSDRIIRYIPSLGILTVKLKKLGWAWASASLTQGVFTYSNIKLFWLSYHARLVEEPVTGSSVNKLASRRYLIDVDLRWRMDGELDVL